MSEAEIQRQLYGSPRHEPRYASEDALTQRRRSLVRWHQSGGEREQDRLADRKQRAFTLNLAGCTVRETAAVLGYKGHSHVHRYIAEGRASLQVAGEAEAALADFCSLPSSIEPSSASRTDSNTPKQRHVSPDGDERMTEKQRAYIADLCGKMRIQMPSPWWWYSIRQAGGLIAALVARTRDRNEYANRIGAS